MTVFENGAVTKCYTFEEVRRRAELRPADSAHVRVPHPSVA